MTPAGGGDPGLAHATLIARRDRAGWLGVLLRGPSGVGKSDLALRAATLGWRIVADDRVRLWRADGALFGRAPDVLQGLCEARGQAVIATAALPFARVALVADLVACDVVLERQPEADTVALLGIAAPRVRLRACDASAPARLVHALAYAARTL